MKNAHEFEGLYDDLFDFTKAGYAMINLSSPYHTEPTGIVKELQYVSTDPDKYWMKGLATKWHVTARGPLDPKVRIKHCAQVIGATSVPDRLLLGDYEVFPSPYEDEKYECIVLRIDDQELYDINTQLAVLPGVQTYLPYKPHMTLGYFKSGYTSELIDALDDCVLDSVEFKGWDFGRMQP